MHTDIDTHSSDVKMLFIPATHTYTHIRTRCTPFYAIKTIKDPKGASLNIGHN